MSASNLPVTFEDKVKSKIKETVFDLIPEDKWDGVVEIAIQEFINNDLKQLVQETLKEKFKEKTKLELAKPEWQGQWDDMGEQASENIKQLLIEAAPLMLANMLGQQAQAVLTNFKNNIMY